MYFAVNTFSPCQEHNGNDTCKPCEKGFCSRNVIPYNTIHFKNPPEYSCQEKISICDKYDGK